MPMAHCDFFSLQLSNVVDYMHLAFLKCNYLVLIDGYKFSKHHSAFMPYVCFNIEPFQSLFCCPSLQLQQLLRLTAVFVSGMRMQWCVIHKFGALQTSYMYVLCLN